MYGGGNNTARGRGRIGGGDGVGNGGGGGRLFYGDNNAGGRGPHVQERGGVGGSVNGGSGTANPTHMNAAGVSSSASSGRYNYDNDDFNDLDDGIDWSSVPLPSDPTPAASTAAAAASTSMASYSSYSKPSSTTAPTGATTTSSSRNSVSDYSASYDPTMTSAQKQPQQQQGYHQQYYNNRQQPQSARPSPTPKTYSPPKPKNLYQKNNPPSTMNAAGTGYAISSNPMHATTASTAQTNSMVSTTSSTNTAAAAATAAGVSATTSDQAEVDTLRKQIEALTEQLQQKDDQLFELGSTLASVEIEANHRAENAEKKTRLAEEQLHRVQKEADAAHASLARQRKRAAAAANAAAAVATANAGVAEDSFVGRDLSSPLRAAVSPGNRGQREGNVSDRVKKGGEDSSSLSPTVASATSTATNYKPLSNKEKKQNDEERGTSSSSAEAVLYKDSEGGRVVTPPAGENSPTSKSTTAANASAEESHLSTVNEELKRAGDDRVGGGGGKKKQKLSIDAQSSKVIEAQKSKLPPDVPEERGKMNETNTINPCRSLARHLLLKDGLWISSSSSPLLSSVLGCLENDNSTSSGINNTCLDGENDGKNDVMGQFFSTSQNLWKNINIKHLPEDLTEANEDELKLRSILTSMAFGEDRHDSTDIEPSESMKQLGVDFLVRELIVMIVGKFRRRQKAHRHSVQTVNDTHPSHDGPCVSGVENNLEKIKVHRKRKDTTESTLRDETSENISTNDQNVTETIAVPRSWLAVLKLLCIFREVLLLSSEARECTRVWLSSLSSSECPSSSKDTLAPGLDLSPFPLSSVSRRVRGLDMDALKSRASLSIPCLAGGGSFGCGMSWKRQNRSSTCCSFIGILIKLSLGSHILSRNTYPCCGGLIRDQGSSLLPSPMNIIERMVQREAILFILSHTCNTQENMGQGDISLLWYNALLSSSFICNAKATSSLVVTHKDLVFDLVSILEHDMDSTKRRRLCHRFSSDGDMISFVESDGATRRRGRGQQRARKRGRSNSSVPKKRSICQEQGTSHENGSLGNINNRLKVEIQCLSLRLIVRLISSSTSVRTLFFRETDMGTSLPSDSAADGPKKSKCLGRRVLAAVLDELEVRILPSLRVGNSDLNSSSDCDLLLCLAIIQLMTSLCKSEKGVLLLRTQMRISDDSDGHPQLSPSGVAVATSLLDCSVGTLYRHRHDAMPQYHGSPSPAFVSTLWSMLLKETVSFFGTLLSHIQTQRRNSERISKGKQSSVVVPFLAVISERKDVLYSCLHLIYYSGSDRHHGSKVDDNTINNIRKLLEELSFDEEEEEEMKHA